MTRNPQGEALLTESEKECIEQYAQGASAHEIAENTNRGKKTVDNLLLRARDKLNLDHRRALIAYYYEFLKV